ncbi:hypothetical protein POM88_005557 [Heracleum sosnowskyi]|uniref:MORF/ORRM1/DAG-like MORF domain-containing protein n=1 Tax=Heracleum sosnowskyi TaxID=360622 RepID=A0AAD8J0Z4_9APIA|nr:hypothetical protein POM88_005557 [Heracleum sosnowskyi]
MTNAQRVVGLLRSVRGFASASGYSRTTVGLSPDPVEGIPWRLEDFGTDYKHWFVSVKEPVPETREEMAAHCVKILSAITGSEDEARKKMYMISTRCYYAFGALISREEAQELKKVPHVKDVLPDSYVNRETKDYGGEPFFDGQLVPYDPKYHKFFDDFWAANRAEAEARDKEEAEARARGDIETDEEDDDDDDDSKSKECKSFLSI